MYDLTTYSRTGFLLAFKFPKFLFWQSLFFLSGRQLTLGLQNSMVWWHFVWYIDTLVLEEYTYWNIDTKATTLHSPDASDVNIYIKSHKNSFGETLPSSDMFIMPQCFTCPADPLASDGSSFVLTFCRAQINTDIFSLAHVESSLVETPPFVTCQSLVIAGSFYTDDWMTYTSRSLLLREYGMVGLGFISWQEKIFYFSKSPTGSDSRWGSYKQGTCVLNQGETGRASCWPLIPF
jgi:hypothetical protein